MYYKKLSSNAYEPTKSSFFSAGWDLYATETTIIKWNRTVEIFTEIAIEIPEGFVGLIFARSGLATKNGIRPANCVGVIDSDYRGEIIVPLYNDSLGDYEVKRGDRVAQLIVVPYLFNEELEETSYLTDTIRGAKGFGSTGR